MGLLAVINYRSYNRLTTPIMYYMKPTHSSASYSITKMKTWLIGLVVH